MIAAAPDNTVAIIALVVSGLVGVAGPIIVSLFAARRTREELLATDERQRRAVRHEGEREVLDAGAVLLQRFRLVTGTPAGTPNRGDPQEILNELGSHLARLLLWFPEGSEVVKAFEAMLSLCALYETNHFEMSRLKNTDGLKKLEDEIGAARSRYLRAARDRLAAV